MSSRVVTSRAALTIARTKSDIRAWRKSVVGDVGFVPTMGALHAGHLSLVRRALRENQTAVASIYVNPTQFGPNEDFNKYPRTEDSDVALLESVGAHAAFIPSGSLYDADNVVRVVWRDIAQTLREAAARPGHFDGVMTVCAKLFNLVQPTRVYVGAKDAAQCIVLARMVRELDFPFELVVCDTLRESDGLAMSSRNRYLSSDDRQRSTVIYRALNAAQQLAARQPATTVGQIDDIVRSTLAQEPAMQIEYVSQADLNTGAELVDRATKVSDVKRILLSFAGRIGTTRLIDNVVIG